MPRPLAVLLGITQYQHASWNLRTAANDARALQALLEQGHGYEVISLFDGEVTRAALEDLFAVTVPAAMVGRSQLLVFFAGHGIADDSAHEIDGYLVPHDGGARLDSLYPMRELVARLADLNAHHLMLVLDCCFAGAIHWVRRRDLGRAPQMYQERYEFYLAATVWQVLTSTAYDQLALDICDGRVLGQRDGDAQTLRSPFAAAFLAGLAGAADTYPVRDDGSHGDGVITATELYQYVHEQLTSDIGDGFRDHQIPGLWRMRARDRGEYVFLNPKVGLRLDDAPAISRDNCPYPGFAPFETKHRDGFGRSALLDDLRRHVAAQSLTIIVGASATGKSSLLRAGLVPALAEDLDCAVLGPFRPGRAPLAALDAALRVPFVGIPHLLVDQLEELVTAQDIDSQIGARETSSRESFLRRLDELVSLGVKVIATLRSDVEPALWGGRLHDRWAAARFPMPSVTQNELREAIEKPAEAHVLTLDPPEMVDELVNAVIGMPGALPLLSFTLNHLYVAMLGRGRGERTLRGSDLHPDNVEEGVLGGIPGALQRRVDEIRAGMDPEMRRTLLAVVLRMVSVQGGGVTRRRITRDELDFAEPRERENARVVLDALGDPDARLIVHGRDVDGAFVEPAHEAVIHGWGDVELVLFQHQGLERLLLLRRLTAAAREWRQAEKDPKLLWTDPRLSRASTLLGRDEFPVTEIERDFVAASAAAQQTRRRRNRAITGVVVAVLLAAAVASTVLYLRAERNARREAQSRREAEAARARADDRVRMSAAKVVVATDPASALALLKEVEYPEEVPGWRDLVRDALIRNPALQVLGGTFVPYRTLRRTPSVVLGPEDLRDDTPEPPRFAILPDDRLFIGFNTHAYLVALDTLGVSTVPGNAAPSPTGDRLLVTSGEQLHVWNAHNNQFVWTPIVQGWTPRPSLPDEQEDPGGAMEGIFDGAAFSPDGSRFLVCDPRHGAPVLRHADRRGEIALDGCGPAQRAWFVGADKLVTFGGAGATPCIWDGATGTLLGALTDGPRPAMLVVVSPRGDRLVTIDYTAKKEVVFDLWDVGQGMKRLGPLGEPQRLETLERFGSSFVRFTPDGTRVLTATATMPLVWDTSTAQSIPLAHVQSTGASGLLFAITGHYVFIAPPDEPGTISAWDVTTGQPFPMKGASATSSELVVSPDQTRIARSIDAGAHERVELFDVHNGSLRGELPGRAPLFSPDGTWVTSFEESTGKVHLLSIDAAHTSVVVQAVPSPDSDESEQVHRAFDPDGRFMITAASDDPHLRVWDLSTGRLLTTIDHDQALDQVFVGRGGAIFATDVDELRVWKLAEDPLVMTGRDEPPLLSPDRELVAIKVVDGVVELRRMRDWERLGLFPMGATIGFSPDDRWFAGVLGEKALIIDLRTNTLRSLPGCALDGSKSLLVPMEAHWTPDRLIVFDRSRGGCLIDLVTAKVVNLPDAEWWQVSPDGAYLVVGQSEAPPELRRTSDGAVVTRVGTGPALHGEFSDDSRWLAVGGPDAPPHLCSLEGTPVCQRAASSKVGIHHLAFTAEDSALILFDIEGRIEIVAPSTGAVLSALTDGVRTRTSEKDSLPQVSSTLARFVYRRNDGEIQLCNATSGVMIPFSIEVEKGAKDIAFSPDGRWLLVDDLLFDAASGKLETSLAREGAPVSRTSISPDSRHIATQTLEGDFVEVYDIESGSTAKIEQQTSSYVYGFSRDGTLLLEGYGGDEGQEVRVWRLPNLDDPLVRVPAHMLDAGNLFVADGEVPLTAERLILSDGSRVVNVPLSVAELRERSTQASQVCLSGAQRRWWLEEIAQVARARAELCARTAGGR